MLKGDWIQTYTGKQFWPLDPQINDIDIKDIAHSLSMLCRFTGHCDKFYSVAEHSIRVCNILPTNLKLYGLLHDASEAYLTDISKPLKMLPLFSQYREAEEKLSSMIYTRYRLKPIAPEEVKKADEKLFLTEARDLMKKPLSEWITKGTSQLRRICPLSSTEIESLFLNYFYALTYIVD